MAGNKVELCGVNTAKLPLLKEEEKEELLARIKEGADPAVKMPMICFRSAVWD